MQPGIFTKLYNLIDPCQTGAPVLRYVGFSIERIRARFRFFRDGPSRQNLCVLNADAARSWGAAHSFLPAISNIKSEEFDHDCD
jgi:hypothetical protein